MLRFATVTVVAGTGVLWIWVDAVTALLALATWTLYVWVYTPLKSRTWLNTAVGAVAGAMPILIGWSAVRLPGESWLSARPLALFSVVFLWQFPHFMAIAWLYRHQYGRAGIKMLPVVDPTGNWAAVQAVLAAALVITDQPASGRRFVAAGSRAVHRGRPAIGRGPDGLCLVVCLSAQRSLRAPLIAGVAGLPAGAVLDSGLCFLALSLVLLHHGR